MAGSVEHQRSRLKRRWRLAEHNGHHDRVSGRRIDGRGRGAIDYTRLISRLRRRLPTVAAAAARAKRDRESDIMQHPSTHWREVSRTVAAVLGAVLVIASSAGAETQRGTVRLEGTVTNASGQPLAGVQVTATNESFSPSRFTATTNEQGGWRMLGFGSKSAPWLFRFELEGYALQEIQYRVSVSGHNDDLDVTLEEMGIDLAQVEGGVLVGARNVAAYLAATEARESGDHATAIARFEDFLADNPGAHTTLLRIAEAYVAMGDRNGEQRALERLLELDPENLDAVFSLARVLVTQGQVDEGLALFERVAEGDPENAGLYYNIAEIYFHQGSPEAAIDFYQRAIAIDAEFAVARKQLGFVLVNTGDVAAAAAAFRAFLELVPADSPDAALIRDVLSAIEQQG